MWTAGHWTCLEQTVKLSSAPRGQRNREFLTSETTFRDHVTFVFIQLTKPKPCLCPASKPRSDWLQRWHSTMSVAGQVSITLISSLDAHMKSSGLLWSWAIPVKVCRTCYFPILFTCKGVETGQSERLPLSVMQRHLLNNLVIEH